MDTLVSFWARQILQQYSPGTPHCCRDVDWSSKAPSERYQILMEAQEKEQQVDERPVADKVV
jgi:hypothetical protein